MKIDKLKSYSIIEETEIKDLKSKAKILKHNKTGARVILMENDDENKVFYICFRTTPKESTGVCHILEHSVLGGSKNFPVKDPFIELAKGSLNTFLNAMTYPDKTVYPVASCNDKDFQNLMHVYLDAVFHPNIYDNDMTFKQEGWHYELEDVNDELKINGIVYNEMKGVFSSPDDIMEREVLNSLFPDNAYSEESGGDPEKIPELTYAHFLSIHGKYYHPSNSYIFLYGNMDMEEKLNFIDEYYLSEFEPIESDTQIEYQKPFEEAREVIKEFSVATKEEMDNNTYLSYNVAFHDNFNELHYLAFQVLDYVLCSAPGAPLKQALLDQGIGTDIYSFYDNGLNQPYFSIVAKNTSNNKQNEFVSLVEKTLNKLAKEGVNKKSLTAALNYYEFKYKEADFGSYPPGLIYGLQILDSWLYDESKPFIHLNANKTFEKLRNLIETDYYDNLIREYLLENTHKTILRVEPSLQLAQKKEEQLSKMLAAYKASLTEEEINDIVRQTKELEEFQERENTEEEMRCIPVLTKEDIKKEAAPLFNEVKKLGNTTALYHPIYTNHISYFRIMFKADNLSEEELNYLGILKNILGYIDTKNYSYRELFNEIYIETGGMVPVVNIYTDSNDFQNVKPYFEWKVKTFDYKLEVAFSLAEEVILNSVFEDDKRLYEIIAEMKSRMQSDMTASGHHVAVGRAGAYFSKASALSERITGLPLFRLVCDLEKNFQTKKEEIKAILRRLSSSLFCCDNVMFDFTGDKEVFDSFCVMAEKFAGKLSRKAEMKETYNIVTEKKNEAFMTAGQVQFVAMAGNFRQKGLPYTGALKMLKVILGYDYLYQKIRVRGGAYGCMAGFSKNGDSFFVSYRDPNLSKTIEQYREAADYIRNMSLDERSMNQYLIGAISDLDMPMTPQTKGLRSLSAYMTNQSYEDLQRERDELLSADGKIIHSLADYIDAFIEQENICVVGSEAKIKEEKHMFYNLERLY